MAGTKAGGERAAATNRARHGKEFYAKIGAKGGRNGRTGGFAANRELARLAGAKGGRISRRSKAVAAVLPVEPATVIATDDSQLQEAA